MPKSNAKAKGKRKRWVNRGILIAERPWSALTKHYQELRLDTVAWHEREMFLTDILKHEAPIVRHRAETTTEQQMRLMIKAYKQGIDLVAVTIKRLATETDWSKLPRGSLNPIDGLSDNPSISATDPGKPDPDYEKKLDAIIAGVLGPLPRAREVKPPPWATRPTPMPWAAPPEPVAKEGQGHENAETKAQPAPETEKPEAQPRITDPLFDAAPEPHLEGEEPRKDDEPAVPPPQVDRSEIEMIREKLAPNGKVRLDLEALSAYLLMPSYFAVACGLNPERWQATILDSYAPRLGVLACRQSGKSLTVAHKIVCFATTNPGTTSLVLSPTMRQSSELLLKCAGVAQIAGLKLASLSVFQCVFADRQAGAMSRIVCLPGGNEDNGASARGYAADCLVFEEAAFLSDPVIHSVLPSIAARPKAQLIAISSAGIIGSFFHAMMTADDSRWQRLVVTAEQSGRFTREQLVEMRLNLGAARYATEMGCKWGSVGDSIYADDVMAAAFGSTESVDTVPELDPEAAFSHLNLEELFTSRPFERSVH